MGDYDTNATVQCPVCGSRFEGACWPRLTAQEGRRFECETCGVFEITREAFDDNFRGDTGALPPMEGALLAYKLRQAESKGGPLITSETLRGLGQEQLPSVAIQATNLLRLIGNYIQKTGNPYQADESTAVRIGAANSRALHLLLGELSKTGILVNAGMGVRHRPTGAAVHSQIYDLSLKGWEQYEAERRGQFSGNYGFIAMKFGEADLDALVRNVLKPSVLAALGFEVIDMRDVARAGVIDNIMRAQIRDAAFVVVDLTHDNAGAYWEAGYAEGLGKPVIYMCERKKFSEAQTHFDTNHCTTVMWESGAETHFVEELIATLRRSLNLF